MLPLALVNPLKDHLKRVKDLHEKELAEGFGKVYLPYAFEKKYPNAAEWMWQYVFPATKRSVDPRSGGEERRHHVQDQAIQRAIKQAVREASLYQSRNAAHVAIRLRRIFCKAVMTFARCRNCSATKM